MKGRVLSLLLSGGAGGLEAVAFQYAKALAAVGFDSALAVNRASPYVADSRVATFPVPGASLVNPLNHLAVARAVRAFRPDVILGHGSRGADFSKSPLVRLPAPRGLRTVGVLHGENARHFHGLDHIIAVSEKLRDETVAGGGFDPASFSVCPNAVSVPDRATLLARPDGGVPVLGFLGRFDPCKGLDVLLRSCARLKEAGVDFRLDVGGAGPREGALRRLADELGLGATVRWLGWISDKRTFFGGLDLFVQPSREEAVGLVMLEAMAHCRAVVLSDCPGPKAIAGACGRVVPRGDDAALFRTLAELLAAPSVRENLSEAGRRLVETRYSERVLETRLAEVMERVLA